MFLRLSLPSNLQQSAETAVLMTDLGFSTVDENLRQSYSRCIRI